MASARSNFHRDRGARIIESDSIAFRTRVEGPSRRSSTNEKNTAEAQGSPSRTVRTCGFRICVPIQLPPKDFPSDSEPSRAPREQYTTKLSQLHPGPCPPPVTATGTPPAPLRQTANFVKGFVFAYLPPGESAFHSKLPPP